MILKGGILIILFVHFIYIFSLKFATLQQMKGVFLWATMERTVTKREGATDGGGCRSENEILQNVIIYYIEKARFLTKILNTSRLRLTCTW